MSTKYVKMWQGEIVMANLNVTDVIKELEISKKWKWKILLGWKYN